MAEDKLIKADIDDEDFSSLSDTEMIELARQELGRLRELAAEGFAPAAAAVAALENQIEHYTAAIRASEIDDQNLAIAHQNLNRAADKLLLQPNLPNAKPIPFPVTGKKGN